MWLNVINKSGQLEEIKILKWHSHDLDFNQHLQILKQNTYLES